MIRVVNCDCLNFADPSSPSTSSPSTPSDDNSIPILAIVLALVLLPIIYTIIAIIVAVPVYVCYKWYRCGRMHVQEAAMLDRGEDIGGEVMQHGADDLQDANEEQF